MIFIKNGLVIDPANGIEKQASVWIEDGKIVKVTEEDSEEFLQKAAKESHVIDAAGCIVAPGLVDPGK